MYTTSKSVHPQETEPRSSSHYYCN